MRKIAVIGVGSWGKNLLRNFSSLHTCQLVYACDLDNQKLIQSAEQYPNVKFVNDYQLICQDPQIDAVAIATTVTSHYKIAKDFLEAGKHVFVEKPFTRSVEEAEDLVKISTERSLVLMVGHLLKYHPAVIKLKEIVDSGELGEIYYIYSQRVSLGRVATDENAMWSLTPHDISIVLYLLGEQAVSVSARGKSYLRPDIDDVCFLNLDFPQKKMANIQTSWLDPHKIRQMTIVGSKKMVLFDDMAAREKLRVYDRGFVQEYSTYGDSLTVRSGDIHIPLISMHEPLMEECTHFIDCVKNLSRPRTDGLEGLEVMKILTAAQESIDSGGVLINI